MDVEVVGNEQLESIGYLLRADRNARIEIRNSVSVVLNCEELLLSILKANTCLGFLKNEPSLCVVILSSFLSLSRKKDWKTITLLLKIVLESDFKEKSKLLQDVWTEQELCRIPAEMILILFKYKPGWVEKKLCDLYSMARKNENIWQSDFFRCWIFWCSKSAELFYIVCSIFNQFLIHLNANSNILHIVNKFITNVMSECETNKTNILSLYPTECQTLAALLMIEPNLNPYRETMRKKIKYNKNIDSVTLLLLLSHYPLWISVLNN